MLEIVAGDIKNFEKGHIMLDWNARPAIVNKAVSIVLQSGISIPVISWELKYHLGESRKEIIND